MEGTDWAGRKVAAGWGRGEGMAAWWAGRDEEMREGWRWARRVKRGESPTGMMRLPSLCERR